ncbi:MAG: hypothetical protein PHN69_02510 [Candidatus Pacebacteria bacterium]|nr:hypothetical protein [Candidatus Paceibacterota bacterium]
MGLFDFILNGKNNNDNNDDNNDDEIILLLPHMEMFEYEIDKLLYSEKDIISGLNEEFEDYIECELVFSRN